ncbi:MAG: Stp1/IreP family PP2C-type Ser/Thr phosphatase [Clostridia bacterium]|nr:Stp1/IreP family PP2C-type Ser/Thr phosphatase [Clostridia bacterium]
MDIFVKTDIGRQRETNQDFVKMHKFDDKTALLIVCDGMGGANAGNVASEVAVNSIYDTFLKKHKPTMNDKDLKTVMTSSINCANLDVFDLANTNEEYRGMGTTAVAVFIDNGYAYTINAGDSRAYIVYPDKIKQITTDHSIVQQLIESNMITLEEAKKHPERNVITRALGVEECLDSDFYTTKLEKNYKIIICSDGLSGYVDDADILSIANNEENAQTICEKLIDLANENGGGDNITVAVAKER